MKMIVKNHQKFSKKLTDQKSQKIEVKWLKINSNREKKVLTKIIEN